MGIFAFDEIARALIANGRAPDTPAMAVRWGTRPDQQTLAGTLATLPGLIHEHDLKPPATIVIGEVVGLRDKLNWFERLPLFGRRIVVTRARGQAEALSSRLRALGRRRDRTAHSSRFSPRPITTRSTRPSPISAYTTG